MKALIAMSGGVDSGVAAFLTKQRGDDCLGVTMKLFDNGDIGVSRAHTCCSLDDVEDARSVAYAIGIPHYVFNFSDRFREKVMDRFVAAYERGATPNPCIDCNRFLKFDKLYQRAKELGCDCVVTGHYARIERDEATGRYLLKKAVDLTKDQSYVLYAMTQEQLAHTRFPLGDYRKAQVRALAEQQGFTNVKKHDSQDICFVPNGRYADFIEGYTGRSYPPGDFVDGDGNVLGRHRGIIRYTVGQHRGLGLSLPQAMYVCALRPDDNAVVLGAQSELYRRDADAAEFHWISGEAPTAPIRCRARLRYRQAEQWATVTPTAPDAVHLEFDEPQRAVTPGQAAVLYDGDVVLGGGVLVRRP